MKEGEKTFWEDFETSFFQRILPPASTLTVSRQTFPSSPSLLLTSSMCSLFQDFVFSLSRFHFLSYPCSLFLSLICRKMTLLDVPLQTHTLEFSLFKDPPEFAKRQWKLTTTRHWGESAFGIAFSFVLTFLFFFFHILNSFSFCLLISLTGKWQLQVEDKSAEETGTMENVIFHFHVFEYQE